MSARLEKFDSSGAGVDVPEELTGGISGEMEPLRDKGSEDGARLPPDEDPRAAVRAEAVLVGTGGSFLPMLSMEERGVG
jgi:hypothetical protein